LIPDHIWLAGPDVIDAHLLLIAGKRLLAKGALKELKWKR
jgi:hypothetical protein